MKQKKEKKENGKREKRKKEKKEKKVRKKKIQPVEEKNGGIFHFIFLATLLVSIQQQRHKRKKLRTQRS